ncbi:MAG: sigma-70 family RNA polymerase sigma factor [Actinomycetota bacterium]
MRSQEPADRSDEELVSAFVDSGDQRALEALLARHEAFVFGLAYRILGNRADALDAAQDVFLTVFRRAHSFGHRSAFKTWLYRLTTNACYDLGRRRSRAPVPTETMARRPAHDQDPDTRMDIEQALLKLPTDQRAVVVLRDLYGLSYQEIAKVSGARAGTVKSRIARGRSALALLLEPADRAEPDRNSRRLRGETT